IFYPVYSKKNLKIPIKTIASLIPIFITDLPKKYVQKIVEKHLLNKEEFFLPYPFPSVSKDEVFFHPEVLPFYWLKALWRGPVWFSSNWLIVKGLQKHGYKDIARKITEKMRELVEKEGF